MMMAASQTPAARNTDRRSTTFRRPTTRRDSEGVWFSSPRASWAPTWSAVRDNPTVLMMMARRARKL